MALMETYTRWSIAPVKGEGTRLWDQDGHEYLDFTSGIGVVNVGHIHPQVVKRVNQQLHDLWHVSNLFQIPAQVSLAERLTQASGLDAAFFCNSGAEANEAAIKLARKAADAEHPKIISFTQSFHGRTLATLTATGQDKVKDGFDPLPEGFVTVEWGDVTALRQAITPDTAAVLMEMVQGEGGLRPATPAWAEAVERVCRENDVLLIVDEIQTGMGRTGTMFAYESYGVKPDLVTLAKGLGNGFPIGCLLATNDVATHFNPGSHGSTFGGNPLAMAAAHGVLDVLEQPSFLDDVKKKGDALCRLLEERLKVHPLVAEIRGRGLMVGIQLVQSRAAECIQAAQQEGLLILPAGPDVLRLLPPLTVSETELTQAVERLTASFAALDKEVSS